MKKKQKKQVFAFMWQFAMFIGGAWAFAGCASDSDIDLGDLDTTIGVGSNGFTFPTSSTNDIKLSDVLKLKEGDCIETLSGDSAGYLAGDYQFHKGDTIKTARPKVKEVRFNKQIVNPNPLGVEITEEMRLVIGQNYEFHVPSSGDPGRVASFSFSNDGDSQVLQLTDADVDGHIVLEMHLTALKEIMTKVDIDIYVPDYFKISNEEYVLKTDPQYPNYQILEMKDLVTSENLKIDLKVSKLQNFRTEFPEEGVENYVVVNPEHIQMDGLVKMIMHMNTLNFNKDITIGNHDVNVEIDMGATFVATHAEGYFRPDITLDPNTIDLVDKVPDFLNDNKVLINLTNPALKLHIQNNIDVEGILDATVIATYKDGTKKLMEVPGIRMPKSSQATETTIVICRNRGTESDYQYIELNDPNTEKDLGDNTTQIYDIAKMLSTIPDKIETILDANVDHTVLARVDLYNEDTPEDDYTAHGRGYEIKPQFDFFAPLNLDEGSIIVYNDTIDGWNEDLIDNDIDLLEGTEVVVDAEIYNGTPLKLHLEPMAVDVNHNKIPNVSVNFTTSQGQNVPSNFNDSDNTTHLQIVIKSNNPEDFKKLDGLVFLVTAEAEKPGITLNSEKQTIKIKNLKISLTGKVSINLDK